MLNSQARPVADDVIVPVGILWVVATHVIIGVKIGLDSLCM